MSIRSDVKIATATVRTEMSPSSVSRHKFDTARLRDIDKYTRSSDLLYRVGRQWIIGGACYHIARYAVVRWGGVPRRKTRT